MIATMTLVPAPSTGGSPTTSSRADEVIRIHPLGEGTGEDDDQVAVYVQGHDRASRRLVRWLEQALRAPVRVVDVDEDVAGATFVAQLSCGGQVTPAVTVGELILFAPSRRDVVGAVQRHAPELLAGISGAPALARLRRIARRLGRRVIGGRVAHADLSPDPAGQRGVTVAPGRHEETR
jgi:hypothetical protein